MPCRLASTPRQLLSAPRLRPQIFPPFDMDIIEQWPEKIEFLVMVLDTMDYQSSPGPIVHECTYLYIPISLVITVMLFKRQFAIIHPKSLQVNAIGLNAEKIHF
jgi:hypothetical protein